MARLTILLRNPRRSPEAHGLSGKQGVGGGRHWDGCGFQQAHTPPQLMGSPTLSWEVALSKRGSFLNHYEGSKAGLLREGQGPLVGCDRLKRVPQPGPAPRSWGGRKGWGWTRVRGLEGGDRRAGGRRGWLPSEVWPVPAGAGAGVSTLLGFVASQELFVVCLPALGWRSRCRSRGPLLAAHPGIYPEPACAPRTKEFC